MAHTARQLRQNAGLPDARSFRLAGHDIGSNRAPVHRVPAVFPTHTGRRIAAYSLKVRFMMPCSLRKTGLVLEPPKDPS